MESGSRDPFLLKGEVLTNSNLRASTLTNNQTVASDLDQNSNLRVAQFFTNTQWLSLDC